jgi:N-acetylglucosaminyl-diphospho-decaprenol L-rhamnosyltransferase
MCGCRIGNAHAEDQRANESPEDPRSLYGGAVGSSRRRPVRRPSISTRSYRGARTACVYGFRVRSSELEQEPEESPLVDVVVVAYNSRATLRDCVVPLVGEPDFTITVVDNASPDDSLAVLSDLPVRALRQASNGGFAVGCNRGAAEGGAPWILFLNPDATIAPDDVRTLAEASTRDRAAIVGPRVLNADGRLAWSQRRFSRLRSTWSQALFLHRIAPKAAWSDELVRDPERYGAPGDVEWLSGACLLVHRDVYESLEGFDERYFLYCEDMDLCTRVWSAGHVVRFEPRAVARHIGGASSGQGETLPLVARSRVRYARRHFKPLAVPFEALGLALTCATHALSSLQRPALRRGHIAALAAALHELRASERWS